MRRLRLLHRYTGLVLAPILLLLSLSGGVLVYKEQLWRLRYPELAGPPARLSAADHAAALRAIRRLFPDSVQRIKFPQPGLAAYHIRAGDGEAFVHQHTHELIAGRQWYQDPIGILTELHVNLGAGAAGHRFAGAAGLITSLMVVSGILLWPRSKGPFRIRHLLPRSLDRRDLLRLHRDLGIVASLPVLLLVLTGSGLVFYATSRHVLNGMFSDRPPFEPNSFVSTGQEIGVPSAETISAVHAALPEARLISYQPPPPGNAAHYFRLKQPGELHPNGRSAVYVDGASGRVIATVDATTQPGGERMAHMLYPLHAAKIGGGYYRFGALLCALALAVVGASGLIAYFQSRRRA